RDPVADLDAVDQAELGELLERPVDARQAHRPLQRVLDVAGADRAVLAAERAHDGLAGAAPAVARLLQPCAGLLGPGLLARAHARRWYVATRAATKAATSTAAIDAPAAVRA